VDHLSNLTERRNDLPFLLPLGDRVDALGDLLTGQGGGISGVLERNRFE
jgi:hypothetical protein